MRNFLFIVIALSFASASWAQNKSKKEADWKEYKSDSLNWKSIFPNTPKEVVRKSPTKAGELQSTTVSYEARDVIYAVVATKYPDTLNAVEPKKLVLAARDALTANGGKVVLDEQITISGPNNSKYDGRDITVEFGKNRVRTRLFYANSCLYQVSVTGQEKGVTTDTAKKFMTAFEITK